MLDTEILKINYGVSYGSVTLKSLQNDNIPELDLLVREAIQNSSDASLSQGGTSFSVNFTTGKFQPRNFNSFLTKIEDSLNTKYPKDEADFLEIRDKNTCGLTGCIRKSEIKKDDHGNFFKLIYDTGKRQTQENAGGNWGFGKSVYYRVGIGIVIFYSRIKTDSGYESRLIITLVEDENKKNADGSDATILNNLEGTSAGKAWWGIREGDDLLPICDDEFIKPVLEAFGLHPFKDNETGTSIIIPYINPQELLDNIIPIETDIKDDVRDNFIATWATSIDDYLNLAIQKWYAPKIHNRKMTEICKKKWLLVSVNNKPIKKDDMLPFFKMVQELYTTAIAKTYNSDYESEWLPEIKCKPVNIKNYLEGSMTAGYVSIIRITADTLNGTQNLLSPYDYVGKFEADGGLNEPIVMFTRDPGMIIDYPISGEWVKNISPPASPEEFIFAFFMPIINKKLRNDLQLPEYAGIELGEYLRSCEASDHMGWNDPAKMQIVARIQKNTVNQIINQTEKADYSDIEATASKLSGKLGKRLLPKIGYGKTKSGGGGGNGGSGGKIINCTFNVLSQLINGDNLYIEFELKFMHSKKDVSLSLIIDSEGGRIDPTSWQKEIGTAFPAAIDELAIDTLSSNIDSEPKSTDTKCSVHIPICSVESLKAELIRESGSNEFTSAKIESVLNAQIHGFIKIKATDKKYRYSINVE